MPAALDLAVSAKIRSEVAKASVALEADILAAHAAGDLSALATGYSLAAGIAFEHGQVQAGCFYLTQAYVFSLDAGDDPDSVDFHARLVALGREA